MFSLDNVGDDDAANILSCCDSSMIAVVDFECSSEETDEDWSQLLMGGMVDRCYDDIMI